MVQNIRIFPLTLWYSNQSCAVHHCSFGAAAVFGFLTAEVLLFFCFLLFLDESPGISELLLTSLGVSGCLSSLGSNILIFFYLKNW